MNLESALWWTFFNVLSLIVLAFFSMQEMACVSFNKIRLHYYVSKGNRRAKWLNDLLHHPATLFGTTLIGVNTAMFFGSECARQTYIALGINPELASISQIILVVIFAELAPMFAARRYAEHVALIGAPFLYLSSKILTPLLWSITFISKIADLIIGKRKKGQHAIFNQEDLQKILAMQDEETHHDEIHKEDVDLISRNIFNIRGKDARQIMQPISTIPALPIYASTSDMAKLLQQSSIEYIPVYHRDRTRIVGIVHPRDFIRFPDTFRIREHMDPPWFITQTAKITHILKDFRRNNKTVAIVIDQQGQAVGMITLNEITEEIFGKVATEEGEEGKTLKTASAPLFILDRTFPGNMKVSEFNAEYEVHLEADPEATLADLMTHALGHQPTEGESVYIAPFELTVKESSLLEVRKITITTRLR